MNKIIQSTLFYVLVALLISLLNGCFIETDLGIDIKDSVKSGSISGTISYPDGSSFDGKQYVIGVDTNYDGGDGIVKVGSGWFTGGYSSQAYTINNIPVGSYYIWAFLCVNGGLDGCNSPPQCDVDYAAHYGQVSVTEGETPNINISLSLMSCSSYVSISGSIIKAENDGDTTGVWYVILTDYGIDYNGDNDLYYTSGIGYNKSANPAYSIDYISRGSYRITVIIYDHEQVYGSVYSNDWIYTSDITLDYNTTHNISAYLCSTCTTEPVK